MEEIHLFIIWSKAVNKEADIMSDLKERFDILSVYKVDWNKEKFSENLSRFYGENLPKNSHKEKHCGNDAFSCIVVKDNSPIYETRKTSKGDRDVNVNLFDAKQLYRSWTGGGHKIHATDNIEETKFQLALLFGKDYNHYLLQDKFDKNKIEYNHDLAGANGWNSFDELFNILNLTSNYIVLRNFDHLEDQLTTQHPDVDILIEDKKFAKEILNAVKTKNKSYRVQHSVKIQGNDINFDIRYVGDNYYDKNWEIELLKTKVKHEKGFYIADNLNLFYSLAYHALIHKKKMSVDYFSKFVSMSSKLDVDFPVRKLDDNSLLEMLLLYMSKNNYKIVEPYDLSVFFNDSLINKRRYIPISIRRKIYQRYLNLRLITKVVIFKILKRLRFV
tara:strand:- start:27230 stop:28393 length:1164 start_codon:yes stop_codon:yes gene_type:complete